jgi:hypothetical protein
MAYRSTLLASDGVRRDTPSNKREHLNARMSERDGNIRKDVDTGTDDQIGRSQDDRTALLPPWIPPLVSGLAVVGVFLHLAFPGLEIDLTTVALLGLALLPWVLPAIQSLKLPGGIEVVLRDLRNEVVEVQTRVQESNEKVESLSQAVERLTFVGKPIEPDAEQRVRSEVDRLSAFLARAGLPTPPDPAAVVFEDRPDVPPFYVPGENEIHIGSDTKDPTDAARPYIYHVLGENYANVEWDPQLSVVRQALTFYYLASFAWGELIFAHPEPPDMKVTAIPSPTDFQAEQFAIAAAWARMLWRLRGLLGPETTDEVIAQAWLGAAEGSDDYYKRFARNLQRAVEKSHRSERAEDVRAIFTDAEVVAR